MASFGNNSSNEMRIKQEVMLMPNIIQGAANSNHSKIELSRINEGIEYISNDLDDDNIQGNSIYQFYLTIVYRHKVSIEIFDYIFLGHFSCKCLYNHTYA